MDCPYPGYEYVNVDGEQVLRVKPAFRKAEQSVAKRGAVEPAPWSGVPFPTGDSTPLDHSPFSTGFRERRGVPPLNPQRSDNEQIGYKPDMGEVDRPGESDVPAFEKSGFPESRAKRSDNEQSREELMYRVELSTELSLILVASFLSLFALSHMK